VARQHIFADGAYLGSRIIPNFVCIPGFDPRAHHSYALFCMRCGEVWGRFIHEGALLTQPVNRPCRKHGDGRLSCPPQWTDNPTAIEADWPDAAIAYEFASCLTYYKDQIDA
jgi:hypothetical protein